MNEIESSRIYPCGGIGASQIGALWPVPCNQWITRADVYFSCLGLSKPKTPAIQMQRGILMEPYLRGAFELKSGKTLSMVKAPLARHKDYPFILCHPDGWLADKSAGLELKRVERNDGQWGEEAEQIPQSYWLQCQHSMIVTGCKSWWFYAEIPRGGEREAWLDIRCVEFQAEAKVQAAIVDVCRKAWQEIGELHRLIQSGGKDKDLAMEQLAEMAKSDSEKLAHAAKIIYPYTPKHIAPAPADMLRDLREFQQQKQYENAAKENIEQLKAKLLIQMGQKGLQQVSFEGGKLARSKDGALRFTEGKE